MTEDLLEEAKAQLNPLTSVHLYSVQKGKPKVGRSWGLVQKGKPKVGRSWGLVQKGKPKVGRSWGLVQKGKPKVGRSWGLDGFKLQSILLANFRSVLFRYYCDQ